MSFVVEHVVSGVRIRQVFAFKTVEKLLGAVEGFRIWRLTTDRAINLIWHGKLTKKGKKRRSSESLRVLASGAYLRGRSVLQQ